MSWEKILTSNSLQELLDNFIESLRKFYQIGKYPGEVRRFCQECCLECMKLGDMKELGFQYLKLDELGLKEPYHFASLLGFITENGPRWYLVDPTYGQFFETEQFKKYMFDNYEKFSLELLEKGYVECNLLNMLSYINGFIYSKAFIQNVAANEVYQKLENLLISQKIVNKDLDDTQNKLIELLTLRQTLLDDMQQNSDMEIKNQRI